MPSSNAASAKLRLCLSHSQLRLRSGTILVRALILLAEAARYAQHSGRNRWQCAVRIQRFIELGVIENDLRLLIRMRLVRHASEVTTIRRASNYRPSI